MSEFSQVEEPVEATQKESGEKISSKSKVATGLLALFAGPLGVDQFYLGKTVQGLISIGITVGGGILAIIIGVILGLLFIWTVVLWLIPVFAVGFVYGIGIAVWPVIRTIQAFSGKATDSEGAIVKE